MLYLLEISTLNCIQLQSKSLLIQLYMKYSVKCM